MTQVDFYILQQQEPEKAFLYACRLAEKAFQRGHRIAIRCANAEQSARMDVLLWSFRPDSFLPHSGDIQNKDNDPIVVCHGEMPLDHHDLLINLALDVAPDCSRFQRVCEIVCQQSDWLQACRQRWVHYRDRGYPLKKHDVQQN